MLAPERVEGQLIARLSFVARLAEGGERAHRTFVPGVEPAQNLTARAGPADHLDKLRTIRLVPLHAAGCERPIEPLPGELMLGQELRRVHRAFHVLHSRNLRVDPFVLEAPAL